MTKILLLLTFALCSRGLQPAVAEHISNKAVTLPAIPLSDSCYTFILDNASSDTLGEVTISGAANYTDFYVTDSGEYEQTICFTAISATIAGTVVPFPNSANIELPNGAEVTAGWKSPSLIEVAPTEKQNMPLQ